MINKILVSFIFILCITISTRCVSQVIFYTDCNSECGFSSCDKCAVEVSGSVSHLEPVNPSPVFRCINKCSGPYPCNDDVSEISIPAGKKVTVWEHENFQGRNLVLKAGRYCLVDKGWNDIISSYKVENDYDTDQPNQSNQNQNCRGNGVITFDNQSNQPLFFYYWYMEDVPNFIEESKIRRKWKQLERGYNTFNIPPNKTLVYRIYNTDANYLLDQYHLVQYSAIQYCNVFNGIDNIY